MSNDRQTSGFPGLSFGKKLAKRGMKSVRQCLMLSALVFPLFLSSSAVAIFVVPISYAATPGSGTNQGGYYNYFDDTGSQLTDGIYGVNNFAADLGNGPAYEWVGWRYVNPEITFQFSAPETIQQVGIDFNRNEPNYIYLPTTVAINGTDFTVDPNAIPDATRGTLYFDGNWTGSSLTVDLTQANTASWIFVDEMTFNTEVVPEPSAGGLLAGGFGLLILHMKRRKAAGLP